MKHIFSLRSVIRIMSMLLLFEVAFMSVACLVSYFYKEDDVIYFLYTIGITLGTSVLGLLCTLKTKVTMGKREGFVVVGSVWVIFSIFGLLPFYLSGSIPSLTDAYFETMSGFSTTGATILNDIESLGHGLLFWRSLLQWIGGMGIIVLSLAILPLLDVGGMSLFAAEVPGPTKDKIHAKLSTTAKMLWGMYTLITLFESFCLWVGGMDYFDAICHSFTTLSTGGFSTKNASIGYWESSVIEYIVIFFMFVGGVNFALFFRILKGKFRKAFSDEELRFYILFIVLLTVLASASLFHYHREIPIADNIRYSLFNVVALITTSGFCVVDYMQWQPLVWSVMLLVMLFSGCSGSTSGGIKTVRLAILFKNSHYEFKRLLHPNAVLPVRFNGQVIRPQLVNSILAFVCLYAMLVLLSSLVFTATGLPFDESLGTALTGVGNIGPAIGTLGPASNFSALTPFAKWFMAFLMLVGRLEIFTILVIFTPAFWKR
ncbi:MAG: TrkH family potassium uptake protein [Paludibacteraceae bacterium]|nr:TrkH family potassium uptake protein [Paludibacteraceae bacterium]